MAKMATLRASDVKTFSLGLVGIRMSLMPAYDDNGDSRPTRNMLCPQHKCRVKQHYRCEKEGHVVEKPVYGFPHPNKPDEFLLIDDSQWSALTALTDKSMQFEAWVLDFDRAMVENSYLIWPGSLNDQNDRQRFSLLYELLQTEGGYLACSTAGDHGTARLWMIGYNPHQDILMAFKCRHASNLRSQCIDQIRNLVDELPKVDNKQLVMAHQVFASLDHDFEEAKVTDTLGEAQWAYYHALAAGTTIDLTSDEPVVPTGPTLEDQLRKSVEVIRKSKKSTRAPKAKSVRKRTKA